jgi:hypothetical protein
MQNTAFTKHQPTQSITPHVAMSDGAIHPNPINIKWMVLITLIGSKAMEMHVKGRERMRHLTSEYLHSTEKSQGPSKKEKIVEEFYDELQAL